MCKNINKNALLLLSIISIFVIVILSNSSLFPGLLRFSIYHEITRIHKLCKNISPRTNSANISDMLGTDPWNEKYSVFNINNKHILIVSKGKDTVFDLVYDNENKLLLDNPTFYPIDDLVFIISFDGEQLKISNRIALDKYRETNIFNYMYLTVIEIISRGRGQSLN